MADSQVFDPASSRSPRLTKLPLELRLTVWEYSLPDSRVFHVKGIHKLPKGSNDDSHDEGDEDDDSNSENDDNTRRSSSSSSNEEKAQGQRNMYFEFHRRHAPPVALRVCRESRAEALRQGFFLSPQPHRAGPGVWFRPEADVLYLDRNQRTSFHLRPGQPRMAIPGCERVLRVGLEWRAFFRDVPRPMLAEDNNNNNNIADDNHDPEEGSSSASSSSGTGPYWRAAIAPLYAYMPHMATLYYVLPMVRHKGGVTWGREPYGAQDYDAELLPLPDATQIPWTTARNFASQFPVQRRAPLRPLAHDRPVVPWRELKMDIEGALNEVELQVDYDAKGLEAEAEEEGEEGNQPKTMRSATSYPPRIIGSWLVRVGAPDTYDNLQVRKYDY